MNMLWLIPVIANIIISSAPVTSDQVREVPSTKLINCYDCNISVPNIIHLENKFSEQCKPHTKICLNDACSYTMYKPNANNSFQLSFGCDSEEVIDRKTGNDTDIASSYTCHKDLCNDNLEIIKFSYGETLSTNEKNEAPSKIFQTIEKYLDEINTYMAKSADETISNYKTYKEYINRAINITKNIALSINQQNLDEASYNIIDSSKKLICDIKVFEDLVYTGIQKNSNLFSREEYNMIKDFHYKLLMIFNEIEDNFLYINDTEEYTIEDL